MKILVTGSAGFIGFSVTKMLINENIDVVGIDNINSYYDVKLKHSRVNKLKQTFNGFLTSKTSGSCFTQTPTCPHAAKSKCTVISFP